MTLGLDVLTESLANAARRLLEARADDGHWQGELSPSALSTATAAGALALATGRLNDSAVRAALDWLARHANADGGWGDTPRSRSNISTTLLAWSAFAAAGACEDGRYRRALAGAETWLAAQAGGLAPRQLAEAVRRRYGRDRTFAAPILTMCALAGRLGEGPEAWRHVPALPFELAAVPRRLLKWLRLPVVSYALPALIAIGQLRHHALPPRNPLTRRLRDRARTGTLETLRAIQPSGGGFLEAAPLTSFVVMSLAGMGLAGHPVAARGVKFLLATVRPDGSWPIDTNLATWVTTLSVNALRAGGAMPAEMNPAARRQTRDWLLACQHRLPHPYTGAAPGGWAWTDLPGGVPDADDTAGAMLALSDLGRDDRATSAALGGAAWLVGLQNRDGGMPTFCRGWGRLPFDRSSPDLTAHALSAWAAWRDGLPARSARTIRKAVRRALRFLRRSQRADGAWTPLWFGNEATSDRSNPTYGTARVLAALCDMTDDELGRCGGMADRAAGWLRAAQNDDGGWGGDAAVPSSIEETALAVDALAKLALRSPRPGARQAVERGAEFLIAATDRGRNFQPAPIGLYFAELWYFERLYPVIFTVSALGRAAALMKIASPPKIS